MKKNIYRLVVLLLTFSLCLGLCACAEDAGSSKEPENQGGTLAEELGYGYRSQYKDLSVQVDWLGNVSAAQGKLYFTGETYDEETGEASYKFYQVNPSTGRIVEIPMPELEQQENVSEYVQQTAVCPDGSGYWMLYERYEYPGGMDEVYPVPADEDVEAVPAEEEPGDLLLGEMNVLEEDVLEEEFFEEAVTDEFIDDYTDYQDVENKYYAKKVDMSGNELVEIDLTEATKGLDYFYPQAIAQNAQGELYIATDVCVLVFDSDGTPKGSIEMENRWIQYMVATGNGTILVNYYDEQNNGMTVCTLENGKLSAPMEITGVNETGYMMMYSGDGDTVMLNDGNTLYSMDAKTGVTTRLLSWLDADINGSNISGIAAPDANTILVLLTNYSADGWAYEMGTLKKTPVDQMPRRTVLTLGAEYLDEVIRDAVIKFNRSSDTYRITLIDYSEYNTADDFTLGSKQLDRDVITGNCPDIVSLSSGHQDKYISKGALADLSALMEQDGSLKMDDLVTSALQGYVSDGKLYGMPLYFSFETMLASKKLVGDRTSWTMSELGEIVKGLENGAEVMSYTYQESFLSQMVYQNLSSFVDFGTASCSFDGAEFKELLKVSALLPTEDAYLNQQEIEMDDMYSGTYMYVDSYQQIQSGELLMTSHWMSDTYSVKNLYNLYTEENGFVRVGYPQSAGNGGLISTSGGLGISAKTEHMDGAWAFLKSLLSDEVQSQVWQFPVTIAAFDVMMEETMEQSYYMEEGEKVYYDDYGWIGDTEYTLEPLTQEQVDDFKAYVMGASVSGTYESDIMDIVTEEAGAYFSGDKTADEVAALIQNRVTIYLGETS